MLGFELVLFTCDEDISESHRKSGMVTVYEPSEELEKWAWNKLPKDMQNIIAKFEDEIIKLN